MLWIVKTMLKNIFKFDNKLMFKFNKLFTRAMRNKGSIPSTMPLNALLLRFILTISAMFLDNWVGGGPPSVLWLCILCFFNLSLAYQHIFLHLSFTTWIFLCAVPTPFTLSVIFFQMCCFLLFVTVFTLLWVVSKIWLSLTWFVNYFSFS